jgi:hypothetical protein
MEKDEGLDSLGIRANKEELVLLAILEDFWTYCTMQTMSCFMICQ